MSTSSHQQYSQHPSTTIGAHKCRQITRVPRQEQHDNNFLKSIYCSQLSDDIDFNTREHFNNLQKQNIATRDLQLQQPQDEEDIEQLEGVQPPVSRPLAQAVAPEKGQEKNTSTITSALLPRPPWCNNKQHHFLHLYFKDHLLRYKQFRHLLHLRQCIVQQESATTILVDLHHQQRTSLTYLMKMTIKHFLAQTSWTSQSIVASCGEPPTPTRRNNYFKRIS